MKKGLMATGIGVVLLLGILFFIVQIEDKEGPVITFASKDYSYTEGNNTDNLLKNVTAYDKVEGDVTNSLMVVSTWPMLNNTTAIVIYAAKDSNNNITMNKQIVNYIGLSQLGGTAEGNEDSVDEDAKNVEVEKLIGEEVDHTIEEGNDTIEEGNDTIEEVDDDVVEKLIEEILGVTLEDRSTEERNVNNETIEYTSKEDATEDSTDLLPTIFNNINYDMTEGEVNTTYPRITLTTNQVKLPKGSSFDVLSYVKKVEDDKDDYFTIWRNIQVVGIYDMQVVGDYVILYYTVDQEGNESNKECLWIKIV